MSLVPPDIAPWVGSQSASVCLGGEVWQCGVWIVSGTVMACAGPKRVLGLCIVFLHGGLSLGLSSFRHDSGLPLNYAIPRRATPMRHSTLRKFAHLSLPVCHLFCLSAMHIPCHPVLHGFEGSIIKVVRGRGAWGCPSQT